MSNFDQDIMINPQIEEESTVINEDSIKKGVIRSWRACKAFFWSFTFENPNRGSSQVMPAVKENVNVMAKIRATFVQPEMNPIFVHFL